MNKLFFIIMTLTAVLQAQDKDSTEYKIKLIGRVSYQGGQIKSGTYKYPNDINEYWYQRVFANIGVAKRINHWLSITAALEFNMRHSFKFGDLYPESMRYSPDFYIDEARGDFSLIDNNSTRLGLTMGYFRFSYNPDVHNLGNNFFRSYCYPSSIVPSELDFPYTRLCGLDLQISFLNGMLFNHFLTTTHTDLFPMNDLSITDIMGFYHRGIRVVLGVQFDRILEMSNAITSPGFVNKVNLQNPLDTTYYTFAGTKIMSCLNFDIKKIVFGENYPSVFGKNDAKVFLEINLLGVKNYYHYYEKRKERIPIAFGVILPTFRALDILSFECEYFGSKYINSTEKPNNSDAPLPDPYSKKACNWKWSVYAKRSFSNFSIIFQIAKDHLQLWSMRSADQIFSDVLIENDDYYYQFKFQFDF